MTITTTPGAQIRPNTSYTSVETLTQSTATTQQTLSTTIMVSTVGAGTATGTVLRNQYLLATGTAYEGMEKVVQMGATGEATVQLTDATATGAYILQADGDFIRVKQIDGSWYLLSSSGATLGTST